MVMFFIKGRLKEMERRITYQRIFARYEAIFDRKVHRLLVEDCHAIVRNDDFD
jgi:hypothetical protein